MSLQEEIIAYANTPDNRSNHRKQSQVNGRTPASATFPQPATPLSAVPPTPSASGPPAKKQKMMISAKDIPAFEAKLIAATASPLYLEPVDSLQEAQNVLQALQDPLFQNKPPAPKTRKRTVAELAADEALAAEEQRFMLIMDERLVPSANAAAGSTAAADGESGAASFEPRFERFKALEEIKLNHLEKARRDQEMKVLQQQASKAKQEQQEQQVRQLNETKLREAQELARRYQNQKMQQANHQALQQHQMAASQNPHAHPQTSNGMMNNAQQVQAHHSSPVPRNLTPHNNSNSSPLVGGVMVSHSGHSMPMTTTTSNQGAGSPPRPGSALQHAHPAVAAAMVNQRGQQPPSRNGTPQMPNGTPRLQQPTPVPRHNTPTPRMSQASPASSAMLSTPVMGPAMMVTPHVNGQHITPQQHAMMQQRHQQQQQQQQAAAAAAFANQQHGMQGSPPMSQLSPQNLQQLAAHQAHQQAQANRSNMAHQELYRQQLQTLSHQSTNGGNANGTPHLGSSSMLMQQQHAAQQQLSPQQQQHNQRIQAVIIQTQRDFLRRGIAQAQARYRGQIPNQILEHLKVQAKQQAMVVLKQRGLFGPQAQTQQQQPQLQQQQQHQQMLMGQQQQAMMNGGMMGQGLGMNGMNGMNGM